MTPLAFKPRGERGVEGCAEERKRKEEERELSGVKNTFR
jgi:hypothetical protein